MILPHFSILLPSLNWVSKIVTKHQITMSSHFHCCPHIFYVPLIELWRVALCLSTLLKIFFTILFVKMIPWSMLFPAMLMLNICFYNDTLEFPEEWWSWWGLLLAISTSSSPSSTRRNLEDRPYYTLRRYCKRSVSFLCPTFSLQTTCSIYVQKNSSFRWSISKDEIKNG